jgi:integrase
MARPLGTTKQPSYRLHKPTGRAVTTIDGKDYYLGVFDSTESRQKYDRLIAEWLLRGRQGPSATPETATINQLIAGYVDNIEQETGKAPQQDTLTAMRWLRRQYGDTLAKDFGPMQYKAVRMAMAHAKAKPFGVEIERTLSRTYVNTLCWEIKQAVRWGTEVGTVPASSWFAIHAVKNLVEGKSIARENKKVGAVDIRDVEAVIEVSNPQIGAMIRLQLLTGMRCGEVFQMRGCDIEMKPGECWRYRPEHHKTEKKGKRRYIPLGPQAQDIVRRFLKPNPTAYLFTPAESSMTKVVVKRLRDGKVHVYRQHLSKPMENARKMKAMFNRESYATAIKQNVRKADRLAHDRRPDVPADVPIVKRWHSHQLRHSAATIHQRSIRNRGRPVGARTFERGDYGDIRGARFAAAERAMMKVG